jgi:hypothetical protein
VDDAGDHAYFQAVEELFVRLRGAPLLLSPADWQVARRWHREGIPLDLVRRSLEEVFEKRKERGARGKISSLRYCAPAVEAAWAALRELTAPGDREEAAPWDPSARLAALAGSLPEGFPAWEDLAGRLRALGAQASETSDAEGLESRLAALDREMLEAAAAGLSEADRAELETAVEATLGSLRGRLSAGELERSRERLGRQLLRRRLGLPLLSLFSPEAEG